tara:strand:- start:10 stop:432 length:423 start_codon:yes stop_codon:yes gene_type:complete
MNLFQVTTGFIFSPTFQLLFYNFKIISEMLKTTKLMKLGITGGMGCGKSQLLGHLREQYSKHIYTIDLDKLAFRNYQLNKWSLHNLKTSFGSECVEYDKVIPTEISWINRAVLGERAFKDEKTLMALRGIVSPNIKKLML